MKKNLRLRHEFVEFVPEKLQEGILYVCIPFATVLHKCFCGCGLEVVTPLTPTDWRLTYNGQTVSLDPSIGNWSFPCQSHYWITKDVVIWSHKWSKQRISSGRNEDQRSKKEFYCEIESKESTNERKSISWITRLKGLF